MNYLRIKLKNDSYNIAEESSTAMLTLSCFFTSDVCSGAAGWKEFILSSKWQRTSSNVTSIEKKGDMVLLNDLWSVGDEDFCASTMIMTQKDFIILLDRWGQLYEKRVDDIIILQDNEGNFSIFGRLNDGKIV